MKKIKWTVRGERRGKKRRKTKNGKMEKLQFGKEETSMSSSGSDVSGIF